MSSSQIAVAIVMTLLIAASSFAQTEAKAPTSAVKVGTYPQEVARFWGEKDGLPTGPVNTVALLKGPAKRVYVGTQEGMFFLTGDGKWQPAEGSPRNPIVLSSGRAGECVFWVADGKLYGSDGNEPLSLPEGAQPTSLAATDMNLYVGTNQGLFHGDFKVFTPVTQLNEMLGSDKSIRAVDIGGQIAVAAAAGLFVADGPQGEWRRVYPMTATRSWAPTDIRGVVFDGKGRLWFACPQGVGCCGTDGAWTLYTGEDGLPYDDFTCAGAGKDGAVWFGTTKGAIRFDGSHWAYRQGRRWLPDDHVTAMAVDTNGEAWFATPAGLGLIDRRPMTFKEKAKHYEDEIDTRHRRTEYGYVLEAHLNRPGDLSEWTNSDSDNDGLWTSMYGAGECFAYGATKDPLAKKRAKNAFEALRFLSVVTQGGNPPALPGFVARTVLPTSGPNPNEEKGYSRESDERKQKGGDRLWKIIHPRWPISADGKWYWKCDTSSDELDGHYFFYALYYDLVADTDDEKKRVRDVVVGLTDHMIEHDFCLVDWDGKPTRWAVYSPKELNGNPSWFVERGLNSLSMLSYLSVAAHMTGDAKYVEAFNLLVKEHGYAMNMMYPKLQFGPGSFNQSDDEMAFMSFYNLVRYCPDPIVKAMATFSFKNYWEVERYELNPFFNFTYAGIAADAQYKDPYSIIDLAPKGPWLEQSVDTLRRFPLDRRDWRHSNEHRKDILPLPGYTQDLGDASGKGYRRNGYVIPVDECYFNHFNYSPWDLEMGGQGSEVGDGTVFLLPYYMGLYHGFIVEE